MRAFSKVPAFAAIVEGHGDALAVPPLVARIGSHFGLTSYVSGAPIRVGGVKKLAKAGELERWLRLADSRAATDATLIILDCDELCPVTLAAQFAQRIAVMGTVITKPVHMCFVKSEFETWFLADAENLKACLPDYGWSDDVSVADSSAIRGAKERLDQLFSATSYKETRDQEAMARRVDIAALYGVDRSFRRFSKCATQLDYGDLAFLQTE